MNNKLIWKIQLSDGRAMYCCFHSENEMMEKTKAQGLTVTEYWCESCDNGQERTRKIALGLR